MQNNSVSPKKNITRKNRPIMRGAAFLPKLKMPSFSRKKTPETPAESSENTPTEGSENAPAEGTPEEFTPSPIYVQLKDISDKKLQELTSNVQPSTKPEGSKLAAMGKTLGEGAKSAMSYLANMASTSKSGEGDSGASSSSGVNTVDESCQGDVNERLNKIICNNINTIFVSNRNQFIGTMKNTLSSYVDSYITLAKIQGVVERSFQKIVDDPTFQSNFNAKVDNIIEDAIIKHMKDRLVDSDFRPTNAELKSIVKQYRETIQ